MRLISPQKWKALRRNWHKFSRNPLSCIGLVIVPLVIIMAVLAPYVTPYPEHVGSFTDFPNSSKPPSWTHLFGTDVMGRDVFTRVIFGLRVSLMLAGLVLVLVVPVGVLLGLIAGYYKGTQIEVLIMRVTDIFLAVPGIVLALAICSVLTPNLINATLAMSLVWWPWQCRMVYSITISLRNEDFVLASEMMGAGTFHTLFGEILPNCLGSILAKLTLDAGWVIMSGAALAFVGLGAQPPTPDLGTMVSEGSRYMPELWWLTVFPALAIALVILGFNLLGDGINDMFAGGEA